MADVLPFARHGSDKRQRTRLVQVRCTEEEYAQLSVAAERAGLTIGAFIRMRCNGTAGERAARRPPVERAALAQTLAMLGRALGLLNQNTAIGNRTGVLPPETSSAQIAVYEAATEIKNLLGRKVS